MGSFRVLSAKLAALGVLSLLLLIGGSILIAVGITRPLDALLQAVRRIRRGDYSIPIDMHRSDEIGILAQGLDHMRAGIAEREQQILKLAYEDSLTQLPNRSQFGERLQREILAAAASTAHALDLRHGPGSLQVRQRHARTQRRRSCAQEVAARLRELMPEGYCVARLGGDEFAVLVPSRRAGSASWTWPGASSLRSSSPSTLRASRSMSAPASASPCIRRMPRIRRLCCAMPTSPCTWPSAIEPATRSTIRTTTPRSSSTCRCSGNCAARWSRTSCASITSRK